MSTSLDGRYLVARAYTPAEIRELLTRIDMTGSVGDLLSVAIRGVFDPLLADCGKSYDDFTDSQKLDPRRYAIPQTHWSAIMSAVTNRAHEWGVAAQLGLELVNVFPDTYDDPQVPEPVLTGSDFRPDTVEVKVNRSAADVIAACEKHLDDLAAHFGDMSPEYVNALRSWHRCLTSVLSSHAGQPITVSREGDLSLYVSTAAFDYGVIFHGVVRRCRDFPDCGAIYGRDGSWWAPHAERPELDHPHVLNIPVGAPQPGTWSQHS